MDRDAEHLLAVMDERDRHLREMLAERDKRYQQRFEASESALSESKSDMRDRYVLLNELRGDVATKTEVDALEKIIQELRGQIADLRERLSNSAGRGAGMTAGWGILVGAVLLGLAILTAIRG